MNNIQKKNNNTYPISKNNYQCIGPCYEAHSTALHPLTLDEHTFNQPFCPITPVTSINKKTGKEDVSYIDYCYNPTTNKTSIDNSILENAIVPNFVFSSKYFINIYYKIKSLEEFLDWLDKNKHLQFRTKERVFNHSMIVYGKELNIIDNRLVTFINDIMIKNLSKIYKNIKKYFVIDNNSINITKNNSDNIHTDKQIILISSYIKSKFLGYSNINEFMSKFIRYYKKNINDNNLSELLVNYMIEYIIKRIELSFE